MSRFVLPLAVRALMALDRFGLALRELLSPAPRPVPIPVRVRSRRPHP